MRVQTPRRDGVHRGVHGGTSEWEEELAKGRKFRSIPKMGMVAGAGFEPATFGL